MKKTNTLYIGTDSYGRTRIAAGKDCSLVQSRWRSTAIPCVYDSATGHWYGSCRMNNSARKLYYISGLNKVFGAGSRMSVNAAATRFARQLAAYEDLVQTQAAAPDSRDVLIGNAGYESDTMIYYRGMYATLLQQRISIDGIGSVRLLAIWSPDKPPALEAFSPKGSIEKHISCIVNKIDEVLDGKRKRSSRRSNTSSKVNSRARRRHIRAVVS